jgi:hypothetical protein
MVQVTPKHVGSTYKIFYLWTTCVILSNTFCMIEKCIRRPYFINDISAINLQSLSVLKYVKALSQMSYSLIKHRDNFKALGLWAAEHCLMGLLVCSWIHPSKSYCFKIYFWLKNNFIDISAYNIQQRMMMK